MPSAWSAERELMLDVGGDKFEIGAPQGCIASSGLSRTRYFENPLRRSRDLLSSSGP